jgi:hypothetical protein
MALADIIIPTRTIEYGSSSFTVRPLCVDDVIRALLDAQSDVEQAVDLFKSTVTDPKDDGQVAVFLASVMDKLPALAARIIAYAADEPGMHETVRRLPVPVQTDAFYYVFEMTFSEPDSLKKFAEKLTLLMGRMTPKSLT